MDEYCKTTGNEQAETEAVDKIFNKNHNILFYSTEGSANTTTQSASDGLKKTGKLLSKLFSDNDECESVIDNTNVNMVIHF
jgi:hypothetical protein